MTDTFESLRPYLAEYLREKGINPKRRFRCLNPAHLDKNPSMGYDAKREKVHCFSCGVDYDLFDLLIIEEKLATPKEALMEASRRYGNTSADTSAFKRGTEREKICAANIRSTDYLQKCYSHRKDTPYFTKRGLTQNTIDRFHLGYDPETDCVILPCGNNTFIRRSVKEKRYLNEKGMPSPLFQSELLTQDTPIFLVEGTFDALSAEELGFSAIALNGAGNREKLAEHLRQLPKHAPILLLPDNDQAGAQWATALAEEFPELFYCPPIPVGKDLNELLTNDREQAAAFLEDCLFQRETALPPAYKTCSAAGQIKGLYEYIQEQAARPALETGFRQLDTTLDGGLYDGLYVLGAISSLGKTAFCMQIADQLAKQGRHVLIFSLEMTAYELMARSISRETFQLDNSRGKRYARTVRGVLDGRRRAQYTSQERTHLSIAEEQYAAYAGCLWFREGDHETGLSFISREIFRHIRETGIRPVVIIDYLQIIAPVDVHFTDKQNLDRIVCALKKLSRAHQLTILAISSFNRENYNVEATMAAFKESGGIDYSADVLLGLQARGAGSRTFNIDEEKKRDPRELELKILKNRSAGLGDPIPFRYYPAFSCFEEC